MRVRWLCLVGLVACGTRPVAAPGDGSERWDALSSRFIERSFARDPGFAGQQGRHEHDGEIVDLSREAISAWDAELHRFRDQAQAFPEAALDEPRRFERDYLLAVIDGELFGDERRREHERSPLVYANAIDPSMFLTREYAPLAQRMAAYVKHARAMPAALDAMLTNLKTPLPRTFVDVGLQMIGGLVPYMRDDVPPLFASVQDAALQAELKSATEVALAALTRATAWLEQAPKNEAFALGPAVFREMLWANERVDTPLDELLEIGKADLARNRAALEHECGELLPGGSLHECASLVLDDKPLEGPLAAARQQVKSLKRFVIDQDLVSIPSQTEALVAEAPPHKRWNQAFIEIPGPFESNLPSTYYIAPPDPSWSAEERNGYLPGRLDLLFITVHEVWPGHFLQFLHANRSARTLGRIWVGYAFAEGWAHYTEELAWEVGLGPNDAKLHVGQLLNALLRDVRFVSALGMHTAGMTVAESEQLFREQALTDAANARQQAARGTFDPGYLNYTLGKLIIRKLRGEWTASRGGRAAYRAFHDQFLSYGGPPLALVRKAMLGSSSDAL